MIDGLKPYPKMKDSGVPWLGEVPEHWQLLPLKRWIRMNGEVLPESTVPDYEFRYLDIGSVGTGTLTAKPQRLRFATAPSRARRVVRAGDTIVSTVRTYLKAVYFVERESEVLICSTGFAVLTPRADAEPKFVSYLCQSAAFTDRVTADSVGIAYPAIAETRLGAFHVGIPPLPEQAAIVRFLDHRDRRIRRYIRAKQKLIKLLEEQKQAIIHRAVTRGLDPDVRLKPSGVEWLGDVPEHWELKKIRQCGAISGGLTPSMADRSLWDGDIPWVTPKDMKRFTIQGASMNVSARALEVTSLRLIPAGSVLLVVRGMILARRVPIARTIQPVTINQDMKAIVPAPGMDAGFLAYRLDAAQGAFVPMIDEAGHGTKRFPTDRWKDLALAIPRVDEQRQLVSYLDGATAQLTEALEAAYREIDLLREFRTRLIADVVTGKLDVREAAARLPQEAEDLEPLDGVEIEGETEQNKVDDTDGVPQEAEA